jgi:hypothetical protein
MSSLTPRWSRSTTALAPLVGLPGGVAVPPRHPPAGVGGVQGALGRSHLSSINTETGLTYDPSPVVRGSLAQIAPWQA